MKRYNYSQLRDAHTAANYRQLQAALKELRTQGLSITVKLNAKKDELMSAAKAILDAQVQPEVDEVAEEMNSIVIEFNRLRRRNRKLANEYLAQQYENAMSTFGGSREISSKIRLFRANLAS